MKATHQFPLHVVNANSHHYYYLDSRYLYRGIAYTCKTDSALQIGYEVDYILQMVLAYDHGKIYSYDDFAFYMKDKLNIYHATDNTYQYGTKISTYEVYELWLNYQKQKSQGSLRFAFETGSSQCGFATTHSTYTVHSSGRRILRRKNFQYEWHTSTLPVRHRNRKIILQDEKISRRSTGWKEHKKKYQWE